jgi:hypothetical protein
MNFFSAFFSAVSNIFGWALNRSNLKNSPEMQTTQKAKNEVVAVDKTNKAIEQKDTNEIRNEIGE